jgi:hypothetical protein
MIKDFITFNEALPPKKRIPYNMMRCKHVGTVLVSKNFKKIDVIPGIQFVPILTEFDKNRSGSAAFDKVKLGVDNEAYMLGISLDGKKSSESLIAYHKAFVDKLQTALEVPYIEQLAKFMKYYDSHEACRKHILDCVQKAFPTKTSSGAFSVHFYEDYDHRLDQDQKFISYVSRKPLKKSSITCSICGSKDYPVKGIFAPKMFGPDGAIFSSNFDNVPTQCRYGDPKTRGSEQAGVCSHCYSQFYSAGQFLLYNHYTVKVDSKVKDAVRDDAHPDKVRPVYTNRVKFLDIDEDILFWTPDNHEISEINSIAETKSIEFTEEALLKTPKNSKNSISLITELDSIKEKRKAVFASDDETYFMVSFKREKGPLSISAPTIGKISQLHENIRKWEEDISYWKRDWDEAKQVYVGDYKLTKPALFQLTPYMDTIYQADKILFDIAIKNLPLDSNYIGVILNNYLYSGKLKPSRGIFLGLINLMNRRTRMVDERYVNIGKLFSILKFVRFSVRATGKEEFEKNYLPAITRMPKLILQRLLEENTYHMTKYDDRYKSYKEKEIKECADAINLNSLSAATTPNQTVDIMSGFLKEEVKHFKNKEVVKDEGK